MNAAELYQKAFASLPEGELGEFSRRLGRDDANADGFLDQGHDALEALHQAARLPRCDWPDDSVEGRVASFSGARRLAFLALLSAEGSLRRGDDRAGLNDLAAVMVLGRHLGQGIYISGMASFPIEDLAVTQALPVLNRVDTDTRREFAERLDTLPAFPDLAQALRAEQKYFRATYRDRFAIVDDADVRRTMYEIYGVPATAADAPTAPACPFPILNPSEAVLAASGETRSGMIALIDEVLAAFNTLIEITSGARSDDDEKLAPLRQGAQSNPLLAQELQSFDTMQPIWDRFRQRFAGLRLAARGEPAPAERPDCSKP
jgi:hypothetical protein